MQIKALPGYGSIAIHRALVWIYLQSMQSHNSLKRGAMRLSRFEQVASAHRCTKRTAVNRTDHVTGVLAAKLAWGVELFLLQHPSRFAAEPARQSPISPERVERLSSPLCERSGDPQKPMPIPHSFDAVEPTCKSALQVCRNPQTAALIQRPIRRQTKSVSKMHHAR